MTDHEEAADLWAQAIDSDLGILVNTNDIQRLVAVLYEHKRKAGDVRMLQFTISQRGGCVLIARTKPTIKTGDGYAPLED